MTSLNLSERPITQTERDELERILSTIPKREQLWKKAVENALVMWVTMMIIIVIVWLLVAWCIRKISGLDFGMNSPAAVWVLGTSASVLFVAAVTSTIRWFRGWKNPAPLLKQDILNGCVIEERYTFNAAKRFQEQEHGGLMYFLRIDEEKVLTLFDVESQDLGVRGEDPMLSAFAPQTELLLIRAPLTRFVLEKKFSGSTLEVGATIELTAKPLQWPEPDELCIYTWNELETQLAHGV